MLAYVAKKYGQENVCHIVTFGTEGAKTVLRDVARVLDYPPAVGAKLAKMVPDTPKATLAMAMEMPDFAAAYQTDADAKRIIDIAMRLEGCKRHSSQHACFAPETLVTTRTGRRRISTIKAGDEVLTHMGRYKPVVETMVTHSSDIYRLVCANGSVLTVTANHPLLLAHVDEQQKKWRSEWVEVRFLQPGDALESRTEEGVCLTRILRKEKIPGPARAMYNLSVLDDSSYVANNIVAHNCGIIVAPGPVSDWLPTSMEKDENGNKGITAQVSMSEAEELGLLKMDFLGLKNMTVIHNVIDYIKTTRGIHIDYHDIPMNDRATYKMLADGLTGGVFQLESAGMTNLVRQMLSDVETLPDDRLSECFERLIAAVALYRPGPMQYIPNYLAGVNGGPDCVHYDDPREEPILRPTYGVLVYQEQLMQIAQVLAGYSMGEADLLRKACGKKKKDVMAKEFQRFIDGNRAEYDAGKAAHYVPGCVANGIPRETAVEIWGKMEKFAEYAFNKSHATCYAYIAVITAYMACHWPAEFYSAQLDAFLNNSDKLRSYLGQAANRHIKVLPPDINRSMAEFRPEGEAIRFGLRGIKGVNAIADDIVAERQANGPFAGVQDFYQRMSARGASPSSAEMESLIAVGAFAFVSANKKALMVQAKAVAAQYGWAQKAILAEQTSLFGDPLATIPLTSDVTTNLRESLDMEMQYAGLYITGHPTDAIRPFCGGDRRLVGIMDLPSVPRQTVSVIGVVSDAASKYTKTGDEMFRFTLGDQYGDVSCVLFPKNVPANRHAIRDKAVVKAVGRYELSEQYGDQFIVQMLISEEEITASHPSVIAVRVEDRAQQDKLLDYANRNPGGTKIVILAGGKTYRKAGLTIDLGPKQLDFLQSNFREVKSA